MTRLTWSQIKDRIFEVGLDRGVLYPKDVPPVGAILAKNYNLNPSAEVDLTSISSVLSAAVTRDTTVFQEEGVASFKVVTPGVAHQEGIRTTTAASTSTDLAQGMKMGALARVKAPLGATMQLTIQSSGTGTVSGVLVFTGTGDWQDVVVLNGSLGANLNPYSQIRTVNAIQAVTYYVDKWMIFAGTTAPAYFDGSTDEDGMSTYEWEGTVGKSRAIRREKISLAVPWNGLTSVDEDGGESAASYYIDGRPFLHLPKPKEFSGTLKAITYPDEFSAIMGVTEAADGMYLDSQMGDAFDLSYRTLVGNSTEGVDFGYKIHLLYNVTATPGGNTYQTLGSGVNPVEFSWEIQAVPMPIVGYRPTAHIVIDTRHMDPTRLAEIEALLYGDGVTVPVMPSPQTIFDLLSFGDAIIITDNGDGTWDAEGSYHNIYMIGDGLFEIDNVNAVHHGDGTYTITTTVP